MFKLSTEDQFKNLYNLIKERGESPISKSDTRKQFKNKVISLKQRKAIGIK